MGPERGADWPGFKGGRLLRYLYLVALIALNAHSFFTMPSWQPDTWQRLGQMAIRDFNGIEPYSFTLFVLFGMFSLLLAVLILLDGRYQRFPAWPFALSMMVLGPSMVFLYQFFRRDAAEPAHPPSKLEELACSRVLPLVIIAISLGALWDGRGGSFDALVELFRTDYITHAMVVDECLFIILTPILVAQDCRREGRSAGWIWAALLLPIVGACLYLASARRGADNELPAAA